MYDCVSHKFNVGTQRVVSLTKQEHHGQSILFDESGENEEVSENKDTIQTERDHIIMLLKRWRTSREETEIQKTKDIYENGKPSVTCSQNI